MTLSPFILLNLIWTIHGGFTQQVIEKWDIFELELTGPSTGNPFVDVSLSAHFTSTSQTSNESFLINGFYDGSGMYRIRFMPNELGIWNYTTISNTKELSNKTGSFNTISPTGNNHGPVQSVTNIDTNKMRPYFAYKENGIPYIETGTTSFSWLHIANITMQQQTLSTIKYLYNSNIFNKLFMSVFPFYQEYTFYDPLYYPYMGIPPNQWGNFDKFNITFWKHLDQILLNLKDIGIIVDLILFRPFDFGHWGFDCMGCPYPNYSKCNASTYNISNDLFYLNYIISRIGSYRNIWYSISNSYDHTECKNTVFPFNYSIWDSYGLYLQQNDIYDHEKSIHHFQHIYNYSMPWPTHLSIHGYQNVDYKYFYDKFNISPKPIILDEIGYEGNLTGFDWGNLTAKQEVYRFWEAMSVGMYGGHSETILPNGNDPDSTGIGWWNYGNVLKGESYKKLNFYNMFMNNLTFHPPFHELFTFCYVESIYNQLMSDYKNVSGCYVSQLYDKINFSYYLVRWTDWNNTDSLYQNEYNTTINIQLNEGIYEMYKIDEWSEKIVLLN
eukprot:127395_1